MIIERIAVENFATYFSAELQLGKLGPIVCLYGKTGAGKTTLLVDAVTCALYGRAYGQKKLETKHWAIQTGKPFAKVEVDFSLGDKCYRVRRVIRQRGGDARLFELSNGGESPLARGREVEREVAKRVGLDYPTFLNTIVVRQGEVYSLLRAGPRERREVFLGAFAVDMNAYRERAREKRDELGKQIARMEERRDLLEVKLREEPETKQELLTSKQKLTEVRKSLRAEKLNLKKIESGLQKLIARHRRISSQLARVGEKLNQLEDRRQTRDRLRTRIEELGQQINEKEQLASELRRLKKDLGRLDAVKPKLIELQQIRRHTAELEKRVEKLTREISDLSEVRRKIKAAERASSQLPMLEARLDQLGQELQKKSREVAGAKGKLENLGMALQLLERAEGAKCPICLRRLDPADVSRAREHISKERHALEAQIKKGEREENRLQRLLDRLNEKAKGLRSEASKTELYGEKLGGILESKKELFTLKGELVNEKRKSSKIEKEVLRELGMVMSLQETEEEERKLRNEINEFEKKLQRLEKVPGELEEDRKRVKSLEKEISKLEKETAGFSDLEEREKEVRTSVMKWRKKFNKKQEKVQGLERERGRISGERDSLKTKLEEIKQAKKELKELGKNLESTKLLKDAYDCLYSQVFHERGLPLAMIRRMVDEVDTVAKEYMGRLLPMFDMTIATDEEGDIVIHVNDGKTVRPLETYSGGEQALLGFVLRLAIARAMALGVKAHPPKCLIIDEGFGPLSAEFRQEVIRTLAELTRDYSQIAVISHMEDIRENPAFTAQVKVWKDEHGLSHLTI